jgi:alkylation response protein AidB-like acyl-CoA dehydrogenase
VTFALNEDQTLIKDTAEAFYADKSPVSAWRALRDKRAKFDPEVWGEISALGFAGTLIGEDFGGSGLGLRALALILEEQGRTLTASPLLQTALIAAQAVSLFGTPSQKAYCLPKIASGEVTCALVLDEGPHHRPSQITTRATKTSNGWSLSGQKRFVPDGSLANWLFVVAAIEDGLGVFVVDQAAKNVTRNPRHSVDGRDFADVVFEQTEVADFMLLGEGLVAEASLALLLDYARMGAVAEMLGVIKGAYDMTLDYLKTRTQFGQVIGSFQALQHRASAMLVEMELSRSCAVAAFNLLDQSADGQKIAQAVSLAKARVGDTLQLVTNEMIQMHGGIGMTDAHDSGFYLKRARVLETLYGSSAFHRDRWATLNGY